MDRKLKMSSNRFLKKDEFIRPNEKTIFESAWSKQGRSSRASWQKCQVNRCPYRKSRFVTSFCASKNDASEIRGSTILSDCWSIMSLNPNFHKSVNDDELWKRVPAKSHNEAAPAASLESKKPALLSSRSSDKMLETATSAERAADLLQIKVKSSGKSRRARRREKFLAFKVTRQSRKWRRCPNPPHNTTSFLMDYHKDEQPFRSDEEADFLELNIPILETYRTMYFNEPPESAMCDEEKNEDSDDSNNLSRRRATSRSWQDYLDHDEVVSVVQR